VTLLDASALLAFVQGEPGAEIVERALESGARTSAVNWSEVAQMVITADRDWSLVRALLLSYELDIESITVADAELAATLWRRGSGLSLADRLCLALAERLDAVVLTCDEAWGAGGRIEQMR
jgi:PIN domain nuclease of toxin-antitoxin system